MVGQPHRISKEAYDAFSGQVPVWEIGVLDALRELLHGREVVILIIIEPHDCKQLEYTRADFIELRKVKGSVLHL